MKTNERSPEVSFHDGLATQLLSLSSKPSCNALLYDSVNKVASHNTLPASCLPLSITNLDGDWRSGWEET